MVKGRREGKEFPILNRHLLLQIDFLMDILNVLRQVSAWGGKRHSCPQAEGRDPLPPLWTL